MSIRTEKRKDLLEQAHDGHEEYHPKVIAKRVGPRRYMSGADGYDYMETIRNWNVSRGQVVGFLIMFFGFLAILLWLLLQKPHFPV